METIGKNKLWNWNNDRRVGLLERVLTSMTVSAEPAGILQAKLITGKAIKN